MAEARPPVRTLLQHIDGDTTRRLADTDPEFAVAFTAYQHESGHRALRDLTDPTLAESQQLVLGLIRDQLTPPVPAVVDTAAATSVLRDGQPVTVDGTTGTVTTTVHTGPADE